LEKAASLPIDKVFDDLNTSENGLTSEEAKLRLKSMVTIGFQRKGRFHSYTSLSRILKTSSASCCL
jgi:hypothetical protein